jgi:hypothetical protein
VGVLGRAALRACRLRGEQANGATKLAAIGLNDISDNPSFV